MKNIDAIKHFCKCCKVQDFLTELYFHAIHAFFITKLYDF